MDMNWLGPLQNTGKDDDDLVSEPKTGGMERTGAGKDDDDLVSEPKTGGMERTGG